MTPEERDEHERQQRAARNAKIVAAREAGDSISEIAARYGLSANRTGAIIRAEGGPAPETGRGFALDIDFRPHREAYEDGRSVRELAAEAGISYGSMHRGLTEAGTEFRRRGGHR
ncbi:transposase [Amycolatopsis lexingtonensis]|uniref:Transposase n=1 Tax=Amycolatopsis lexingtonensis TaxID=218822 RepID=A0ABR9HZG5_9PSEU|nr:helix-turn-helix domain-containing protein [Amycolatopsis lexingtonensis]MBE1496337.1 transposase [Amycolatopsis lexingtonensis]